MLHKPETYATLDTATYAVGSNGDSSERIFLSKEAILKDGCAHAYLDFFNAEGTWVDGVKIVENEDGFYYEDTF